MERSEDLTLHRDWQGRDIAVGDSIVYVTRQSSSTYLHEAVVEELNYVARWDGPIPTMKVRVERERWPGKNPVRTLTALTWTWSGSPGEPGRERENFRFTQVVRLPRA